MVDPFGLDFCRLVLNLIFYEIHACTPPPPISTNGGWIPSDDAPTHPSKLEQNDALECPTTTDNCAYLTWSIDVLVRQMKYYRWDAQRHSQQGRMGGYNDHKKFYNNTLKPQLIALVARARALGCPYNPEADQEITRNFDFKTPRY